MADEQRQAELGPTSGGGGTLFTEPVLVVNQKMKLIEMVNEYAVFDQQGTRIGAVGEIVQKNVMGKIRFSLLANGNEVGTLNAEYWRAWNFNIQDASGAGIARITKTWEGLSKTAFTTADNDVVQIHAPLDEPLRSLAVAAALLG